MTITDEYNWRLGVEVVTADEDEHQRAVWAIRDEVRAWVVLHAPISETGHEQFVYSQSQETIDSVHRAVDAALERLGLPAVVTIDRWDEKASEWQQVFGPPGRHEERERRSREEDDDRDDFSIWEDVGPRARALWLAAALACAIGGVWWYASSAGVGSYQASLLLALPLILTVAGWLHRRLPTALQWALALSLAVVGPVGYLVWGGVQWWNWGQDSVLPLGMLLVDKARLKPDRDPDAQWYGGAADGPWGPP
jgi:hypothetical protein